MIQDTSSVFSTTLVFSNHFFSNLVEAYQLPRSSVHITGGLPIPRKCLRYVGIFWIRHLLWRHVHLDFSSLKLMLGVGTKRC